MGQVVMGGLRNQSEGRNRNAAKGVKTSGVALRMEEKCSCCSDYMWRAESLMRGVKDGGRRMCVFFDARFTVV